MEADPNFHFYRSNDGRDGGRNELNSSSRQIILLALNAPSTPTPNKHFLVVNNDINIYVYIYIYIYIYIHIQMFRSAQDSSVWLGLTSREQLMSPECSKHQVLRLAKMLVVNKQKHILFLSVFSSVLQRKGSTESDNAIVETTRSSRPQARRSTFFTQIFTKESEAYLKSKTVTLAPPILLFLDFHFSKSPSFFFVGGSISSFFLMFPVTN